MPEKRRFIRWKIGLPAKIRLAGAEAFAIGNVQDISLRGIQISLKLKLPKDTVLKLKILLDDEYIVDVEVWVVWHKTIDVHNLYGIYFTKISDLDKEKIYKFLRRDFPEQVNQKWWQGIGLKKGGEIMLNGKFQDRRVFARLPVILPLRLLDLDSSFEGIAQTQEISAKGIGIVTDKELVPKTPLEMWLKMPDESEPLYIRGEVVWSKRLETNKYRVGISLEKAELMGISRVLRAV